MGGGQKHPFWGTLNIRCRIIVGIQKGDHNFDSHPRVGEGLIGFRISFSEGGLVPCEGVADVAPGYPITERAPV